MPFLTPILAALGLAGPEVAAVIAAIAGARAILLAWRLIRGAMAARA